MKNAISWFEIPCTQLDQAQVFYETILSCRMRREPMGPSEGAIFPYEGDGVGGSVMAGPTAPRPSANGTLIYLDASPSLDAVLPVEGRAGEFRDEPGTTLADYLRAVVPPSVQAT